MKLHHANISQKRINFINMLVTTVDEDDDEEEKLEKQFGACEY